MVPDGFKGDVVLWCRLLLPGAVKRIYNLQSKQLVKLFARILKEDEDEMLEDLEQGDVAVTIKTFFERSDAVRPCKSSELTLQQVLSLDELPPDELFRNLLFQNFGFVGSNARVKGRY